MWAVVKLQAAFRGWKARLDADTRRLSRHMSIVSSQQANGGDHAAHVNDDDDVFPGFGDDVDDEGDDPSNAYPPVPMPEMAAATVTPPHMVPPPLPADEPPTFPPPAESAPTVPDDERVPAAPTDAAPTDPETADGALPPSHARSDEAALQTARIDGEQQSSSVSSMRAPSSSLATSPPPVAEKDKGAAEFAARLREEAIARAKLAKKQKRRKSSKSGSSPTDAATSPDALVTNGGGAAGTDADREAALKAAIARAKAAKAAQLKAKKLEEQRKAKGSQSQPRRSSSTDGALKKKSRSDNDSRGAAGGPSPSSVWPSGGRTDTTATSRGRRDEAKEHVEALHYTAKGELEAAEMGHRRVEAEAKSIELRAQAEARASKLRAQMRLEEARAEAEALRLVTEARMMAHSVAAVNLSPTPLISPNHGSGFAFPPKETTSPTVSAPPVCTHIAKHTFSSREPGKLSVQRGTEVCVTEVVKGWAYAEMMQGTQVVKGWVPESYLTSLAKAGPAVGASSTGAGPVQQQDQRVYDEDTPGFGADEETYL
eukprot:m.103368 g.103368  ORF g.103368 m.103368 type:complete len:542 (-) comp10476_c0_seq2:155-1780(-)